MQDDLSQSDARADPALGVHPVVTGIGAAAGGIAADAAVGTVVGPAGTVVGAALGALVGALSGKEVAEHVGSAVEGPPDKTLSTSKRILVVDGEKDVAQALRYTLEDEGFVVVTVTDENEALEKVAQGKFDAVVLDIATVELGRLAIAQKLRADASTPRLPIIVLSELNESVIRETFTAYDLFVSKTADISGLATQLMLVIERANPTAEGLRT